MRPPPLGQRLLYDLSMCQDVLVDEDQVMDDVSQDCSQEGAMEAWQDKREAIEKEITAGKMYIAGQEEIDVQECLRILTSIDNDEIRLASRTAQNARKSAFERRELMTILKIQLLEHIRKYPCPLSSRGEGPV